MATVYDLGTGKDPVWDATKARFAFQEEQSRRDAEMRRLRAKEAAERAQRELTTAGVAGMNRLAGNAEQRGLLSSGLYEKAKADQAEKQGLALSEVTRRRTEEESAADADLTRALASLMVDREGAIAESRLRMTAAEQAAAQRAAASAPRVIVQAAPARPRTAAPAAVAPRPPTTIGLPPLGMGSFNSGVGNQRPTTASRSRAQAI